MSVGDWCVAGEVRAADGADVDLPPEPEYQPPFPISVLGPGCVPGGPALLAFVRDAGVCGGSDGVVEELGGGPSGRLTAGTVGPSRRMTAWKWTWPCFWYSATLAYESVAWWRSARWVRPAAWRSPDVVVVKRAHRAGACAFHRTAPV